MEGARASSRSAAAGPAPRNPGAQVAPHGVRRDTIASPFDMWRSNLGTKLGQHMDWVVFFRQFVYHAAFPASLPLIWLLEGKQALYNQSFIPAGDSSAIKASLFHQLLMYLIPWCAMVLWLADPGAAPGVELLVTVGAWWLRSLMIAVKYGYMDPDVYRRSRACPTSEALTFQARFQLISGWANPVEVQLVEEVRKVAELMQIDPDRTYFLFDQTRAQKVVAFVESSLARPLPPATAAELQAYQRLGPAGCRPRTHGQDPDAEALRGQLGSVGHFLAQSRISLLDEDEDDDAGRGEEEAKSGAGPGVRPHAARDAPRQRGAAESRAAGGKWRMSVGDTSAHARWHGRTKDGPAATAARPAEAVPSGGGAGPGAAESQAVELDLLNQTRTGALSSAFLSAPADGTDGRAWGLAEQIAAGESDGSILRAFPLRAGELSLGLALACCFRRVGVVVPLVQRAVVASSSTSSSHSFFAHVADCEADSQRCGFSAMALAQTLFMMVGATYFCFALFLMLEVGHSAYRRTHTLLRLMGQFITSELHTDMFGRAGCARPLVSLKVPANVITWVYLRNAAIDIGRQFQARIQVVTSAALLLLFGFLVAVVVRAFLDKSRLNDWTSSPGTEQELLLYAVALCVGIIAPIIGIMLAGEAANMQANEHVNILARLQLNVRQLLYCSGTDVPAPIQKQLGDADVLINTAMQEIQARDALRPIQLLGIRADSRLLVTTGTLGLTLFTSLGRVLLSTEA